MIDATFNQKACKEIEFKIFLTDLSPFIHAWQCAKRKTTFLATCFVFVQRLISHSKKHNITVR